MPAPICPYLFFFNDTATTEIYTLSLHDALPISGRARFVGVSNFTGAMIAECLRTRRIDVSQVGYQDRKSTRLDSSHLVISYAVFCLKKKKKIPYLTCFPAGCQRLTCHTDLF